MSSFFENAFPPAPSLSLPSLIHNAQPAALAHNEDTMYGWERKSGKMRDHFAEEMTEDDVLRVLNQTKSALLTPSSSSAATNRKKNGDDGDEEARPRVMLLPSPPPRAAAVPEGASFDVWTDAKAAGVDAYQRGDFRDAAACFATAAGMLTAHRAARVTRRPASTSPSDLAEAVHDVTLDDDDEQGKQAQEQRETLLTPAGDIAVDLSALHSNRSSALLVGWFFFCSFSIKNSTRTSFNPGGINQ